MSDEQKKFSIQISSGENIEKRVSDFITNTLLGDILKNNWNNLTHDVPEAKLSPEQAEQAYNNVQQTTEQSDKQHTTTSHPKQFTNPQTNASYLLPSFTPTDQWPQENNQEHEQTPSPIPTPNQPNQPQNTQQNNSPNQNQTPNTPHSEPLNQQQNPTNQQNPTPNTQQPEQTQANSEPTQAVQNINAEPLSQPTNQSKNATKKLPPQETQNINESQTAEKLSQEKQQDRQKEAASVDEQVEDDTNIDQPPNDDPNDDLNDKELQKEGADALAINVALKQFKATLNQKRNANKSKRLFALIVIALFLGVWDGGLILFSFIITMPGGFLMLMIAGSSIFFGITIYLFYNPIRSSKVKVKPPPYIKDKRQKEKYKRHARPVVTKHMNDCASDVENEMKLLNFFRLLLEPLGILFGCLGGIILLVALVVGLFGAVCEHEAEATAQSIAAKTVCATGDALSGLHDLIN